MFRSRNLSLYVKKRYWKMYILEFNTAGNGISKSWYNDYEISMNLYIDIVISINVLNTFNNNKDFNIKRKMQIELHKIVFEIR